MKKFFVIIIIICIVICISNNAEHFDDTEAIRNIASIYNQQLMTQTNLNVTGSLNVSGSFNLLPKGIISMWAGSAAPFGWSLCDGTNGTPDLRSRFIVGAGSGPNLTTYSIGTSGGLESVKLSVNNIPPHAHALPLDNACFQNGGCDARRVLNFSGFMNGGIAPELFIGKNVTAMTGGGNPFDIRPPFYALAYIMKL